MPFFALDFDPRARTIARMSYTSVGRAALAERLYTEAPRPRPDWLDEQLLRPGQVAALFQVSRRTVADWARAGKLDAIITPGGHRRFRPAQVRALLEAQRAWLDHPRDTTPTTLPSGSPKTPNSRSPGTGLGVEGT